MQGATLTVGEGSKREKQASSHGKAAAGSPELHKICPRHTNITGARSAFGVGGSVALSAAEGWVC